jgi:hypothetical protein
MQPPVALANTPPTPVPLDPAIFDPPAGVAAPRPAPSQLSSMPQDAALAGSGAADRAVLAAGLGLIRAARADLSSATPAVASAARVRLIMTVFHLIGYVDGLGGATGKADTSVESLFSKIGRPSLDDHLDELEAILATAILRPDTRSWQTALDGVGTTLISVGTTLLTIGLSQPLA